MSEILSRDQIISKQRVPGEMIKREDVDESHLALLDENERLKKSLALWMKLSEGNLTDADKKYLEEHPTDFSFLKRDRNRKE